MFDMLTESRFRTSSVNRSRVLIALLVFTMALVVSAPRTLAQTTTFTYQGRLTDAGAPASGAYDLEFKLYDAAGAQVGATLTREDVAVTDGVFTVELDFGVSPFASTAASTLEIGVRPGASTGAFTALAPRQPITSSPYAIKTLSAAQLGGVAADQYVQTNDARLSDARPPASGSSNYVQNQTAAAQLGGFNISGNGTVGGTLSGRVINAATQFNLGGSRLVSSAGAGTDTRNLFVGFGAGQSTNPFTVDRNSFFGSNAGLSNATGRANSYFGADAGRSSLGNNNTFIGSGAGSTNTTGSNNTLIGARANVGVNNLTFATAIGADAVVLENNSIVLGRFNGSDKVQVPGRLFVRDVGIGTAVPQPAKLHVQGFGFTETSIRSIDERAILSLDSQVGGQRRIWTLESGVLGRPGLFGIFDRTAAQARLMITENGDVGIGTASPNNKLSVNGGITARDVATFGNGISSFYNLQVRALVGGTISLCRNSQNILASCSSSLRYKTDLQPFSAGLKFINQLRPISFKWKSDAALDVGFAAEDVARVNPLFVTYNDKGEVEGVKYDRFSVAFVNAIKEQQAQIERQQKQIDELKKLVCRAYPAAEVCKQ